MNTADSLLQPAFQETEETQAAERLPTSKLAIVALALGIISLLAPLSSKLVMLSILAAGLGGITAILLSYTPYLRGRGLAQAGMAMGIASGTWSMVATTQERQYLYEQAGQRAIEFVDLIAEHREYEALELMKSAGERQITGTDLKAYHDTLTMEAGDKTKEFLNSKATQRILAEGQPGQWRYMRGVEITGDHNGYYIKVEVNKAGDTNAEPLVIIMYRSARPRSADDSSRTAYWHVHSLKPQ